MRNVILFIRTYFTFFSFLLLQLLALSMLVRYNKTQRAFFLGKANEVTGFFNSRVANIDEYFHLKEENERVHKLNDSLMNLLSSSYMKIDTGVALISGPGEVDSAISVKRYLAKVATVVSNSVIGQKNYFQINKGSKQGIKDNMAVINSDGSVVGQIVNVSTNFSQAMSLLHIQSRVSAMMKKSGINGRIEWDGVNPLLLVLRDIPKSDSVSVGDTVLTGMYSYNFPPGWLIGTIASVVQNNSSNFYTMKVKPSANFQNLQQVFVIENLLREEQVFLDNETKKKVDQLNRNRK